MSYLSELLRLEQIQLELKARDQAGVLRELVSLVPEIKHDPAQQEAFVQALLERERLHTTGIGDGIALPHARSPLGGLLKRPIMVFGRHPAGVIYGALDNKPVQLFFLLASPNLTDHLAMLARLSRVLRDAKVRSGLLATANPVEIIHMLEDAEHRTIK